MNNDELLEELADRIANGELTREQVLTALDSAAPSGAAQAAQPRSRIAERLSRLLYFLGGGVVFLGLAFLVGQQWDAMGSAARILTTLGSGIAAFTSGVLLTRHEQLGAAGPAFFLLSALLMPTGLFVAYDEMGVDVGALAVQIQISGALFVAYLVAYLVYRGNELLAFAIIFAVWFFFAATNRMVEDAANLDVADFVNYRILGCGLALMSIGYAFSGTAREALSGWLYAIGVCGFLGAGFALGGWKPNQSVFWEAVYPGLVLGVIFLSIKLRSRSFLIFGSLALGAYLTKITAEYFSDSLGWAFSLVILGFLLMGIAYAAVRVHRQYVSGMIHPG